MEITVTVNAPELAGAITKLALAIEGAALNKNGEVTIPAGTTTTVQSVEQVVQPTTVTPVAPQQTAPAPQPQAQTIPMPQPTAPVPQPQAPTPAQQTTAQPQQKALTLNDIATAGAGLVDQGKMQQVIELLGKYGVQAITQLQPTQFDAFAGELRALGAAI
jgi:hypothetical protein